MCVVSPPMQWEVEQIEAAFASAVFSGIRPDQNHLDTGGFHVCLNHLWGAGLADDYSNTRHNDESPPVTVKGRVFSAAHDISFGLADMKRVHANVRKVWLDTTDPRRFAVNAINCWDGSGDAVRYDFPAQSADYATDDHKWHVHSESPRLMVDVYADEARAWKAARARVSIITGQSKAAWLAAEATQPAEGGDVSVADLESPQGQKALQKALLTALVTDAADGKPRDVATILAWVGKLHILTRAEIAKAVDAAEAKDAARDAAVSTLLSKVVAAAGSPLSPAQFGQALEAMKAAAASAGQQAVDRIEARLAAAAKAEADAYAAART